MKKNAATDDRLRRVIEAAGICFAERGLKAAKMDEIAANAGVSKPFLYKYFESKDLLTDAVVAEALESWRRVSEEAIREEDGVVERLAARLRATAGFALERPILRTLLVEDRTLQVSYSRHFREARERTLAETRQLLRDGVRSGEISRSLDVEAMARVLEILTHGLVQSLFGYHVIERSDGMVEAAVELLRSGLPSPKLKLSRKGKAS